MFKTIRVAVLLASVSLAFSALAQPGPDDGAPQGQAQGGQAVDPPTRVARLSFMRGDVSFVPAGENDWVEAQLNRPLITGDKLWTDHGARAELEIGSSTIRTNENTSFDFLNLDDKTAQVELTQGSLNLRVRRLYDEQSYEIDTPTLAFVINRVGEYRVDVLGNGQATVVNVIHGGGEAYGEGGARFRIEEGQSVTFNDPQLQNYQSNNLPPPDEFDSFCSQRDHRWDNATSRKYVSEEVIGYEDLDDNGDWNDVPEYGHVWYPTTVAVGWSPYHNGHWGWVGSYGWSWVDASPWGFAPFHYGRWAYIGNRWGWCPGPVAVRPVYAPALVAFVGGGVGVGIGFGSGPVGWFPLGPRDVYFPGYHVSEHYFTNINVSNTVVNNTVINNYYGNYSRGNVNYGQINYANRNVSGAVVAVPAATFVGARPIAGSTIAVNQTTFANARVSSFAAVAPTHASLASATAARAIPPAAVVNRPIVAATKPPPPTASFAQREATLQKNPGQPLSFAQAHPIVTGAAVGAGVGAAALAASRSNVRVVTPAGAPVRTAAPVIQPHTSAGVVGGGAVNKNAPPVQTGRGNLPAVQSNTIAPTNGNAASRLDSSRFAHPGATPVAPTTSNPNVQKATGPATSTQSVQHGPVGNANSNMGTKYTPPVNNGNPTNHVNTPPVTNGNPVNRTAPTSVSKPASVSNGNQSNYSRDSGYGHNSGTPAGKPEYHQPAPSQTNQYHAPVNANTTHSNAQEVQHVNPQQQVQHVNPPPPQVQRTPPPPPNHAPPPPPKDKDKKDDDKKHGG
jgi:uncharacterized protein DUF6600